MASNNDYTVREVRFDEWADVDTLVHRASISSGDFDYMFRPLCSDCGADLEIEYSNLDEGGAVLSFLVCEACGVMWRMAAADSER